MGRITAGTGLITGLDITSLVTQLVNASAGPRDQLKKINDTRESQQLSYANLSAQLLGLQVATRKLESPTLFTGRTATSSDTSLLTVTTSGTPTTGTYQFVPIQTAQAQSLLSNSFASSSATLSAGKFTFGFGGFLDGDTSLDTLNGGAGFQRGKIRVTDRSGSVAVVDLSAARTVQDVVDAVNDQTTANVALQVDGDKLRIVDKSGSTATNLRVDEVGSGRTAASLGLAGVNVAASQADGLDVVRLYNDLSLDRLNDGLGVRFDSFQSDLRVTFRDQSSPLDIDLRRVGTAAASIGATTPGLGRTNAQISFTATEARPELVGAAIKFENDSTITRGKETVAYDSSTRTLTFKINQGQTTANDVVAALNRSPGVAALFTAKVPTGSTGTGIVILEDGVTLDGPKSAATTIAAGGASAAVSITAKRSDPALDGYQLSFVDDNAVTAGNETVELDDQAKTIKVHIAAGSSTAAQVTSALNATAGFSDDFTAAPTSGGGSGVVTATDTATTSGGTVITPGKEQTIGDILSALNAADPTRLRASLSADGDRIELTDLTADTGGSFSVSNLNGSHAASDLGLTAAAQGGTIDSGRLLAGLQTTLLKNLNGGAGPGTLGTLNLTDRSGASATVDLSSAETITDIVDAINASGIGVTARVNDNRDGLTIEDTTGASTSNLIVANGDATNTADKLGLSASVAETSVDGGSLNRRTVSENTLLSTLNGGAGVAKGTITLQDSAGQRRTFNLANSVTVGDVLRELNGAGLNIQAKINDAGDGIAVLDTVGGPATLIASEGNSTTARDLHLLRQADTVTVSGNPRQQLNGSNTYSIDVTATDTLAQLADRINTVAGSSVTASVVNDGSQFGGYRLSLISNRTGAASALLVDGSAVGVSLTETASARDALLAITSGPSQSAQQVVSSANNTFSNVVNGLSVQVLGASTGPVSVSVDRNASGVSDAVQDFVNRYNAIHDQIATVSSADNGPLPTDPTLIRLQTELSNTVGQLFTGTGSYNLAASLGIKFYSPAIDPNSGGLTEADFGKLGTLTFDSDKLNQAQNANPDSVQSFFATKDVGFAFRFDKLIDQLASSDKSLLALRMDAINEQIQSNQTRIDLLTTQLTSLQDRLTNQFNQAELAIAKLKQNQTFLSSVQPVTFASSSSSSSSSSGSSS